jgi:sialic acid synthase SpsE
MIKINNNIISHASQVYFIADIAANHDGDRERAKHLILLAKKAGADAVKFQHHNVNKYVSDFGFKKLGQKFSHQSKWDKTIFEVYKDAEVPMGWTEILKNYCYEIGIDFFSTPYDLDMVDHLDPYVPAYKIGSGDIIWDAMIEKIASKNKPVLVATGAANLEEVVHAHKLLVKLNPQIILMQCNTNYTGSIENFKYINLNVLKTYSKLFPDTILGLSDHTSGHETVLGAVALGAKAIEKHFTDDKTRQGPDHSFSMDPIAWKAMVDSTRLLEASMGSVVKKIEDNEKETVILQRRAVRASRKIHKGEKLERNMIEFQRPCPRGAMKPNEFATNIGKTLKTDVLEGECLNLCELS